MRVVGPQAKRRGWIYGLQDGLLRDLDTTVTQPDEVASSYREALSKLS